MLDRAARLATGKNLPCAKTLIAAALEKYRFTLKANPDAAAPMSALLAFDGRAADAFQLLSSMKASLSAKILTTSAVAVLRNGNSTPSHFDLVKSWIDAALKENPNVSAVRLNLAELHALRMEYPQAEPIYREVLKSEPDNVVALNNLAWILAPRSDAVAERSNASSGLLKYRARDRRSFFDTRARIFIARGDFERVAIEDL